MSLDRTKPEIDFPGGEPPTSLQIDDEIVGDGAEAGRGSKVDRPGGDADLRRRPRRSSLTRHRSIA